MVRPVPEGGISMRTHLISLSSNPPCVSMAAGGGVVKGQEGADGGDGGMRRGTGVPPLRPCRPAGLIRATESSVPQTKFRSQTMCQPNPALRCRVGRGRGPRTPSPHPCPAPAAGRGCRRPWAGCGSRPRGPRWGRRCIPRRQASPALPPSAPARGRGRPPAPRPRAG